MGLLGQMPRVAHVLARPTAGDALQVWRNDMEAVERVLEAGVRPGGQDEESGW